MEHPELMISPFVFRHGIPSSGNRVERVWVLHLCDVLSGVRICLPDLSARMRRYMPTLLTM